MPSNDSHQLLLALRALQLPLASDREQDALESLRAFADTAGLSDGDLAIVIEDEANTWATTGTAPTQLQRVLQAALQFTPSILDAVDARSYVAMCTRLRNGGGDVAALPHAVVRRLLSRASLIAHLLGEERFSCSQVARLLHATEHSLDVPYGAVTVIARELRLLPSLNATEAGDTLWDEDSELSLVLFPDSTLTETSEIAATEVETWLPEVGLADLLNRLSKAHLPSEEPTWPYLQMLHWCLTPIEFYDHPASYLYEFAPRGQVGNALFARYPTVTGNPVLNNAKAVETLNNTWARNRGGDDAHALVSLLAILESLPFVPRRQIARVLRAWLARVIELRTVEPTILTDVVSTANFERATSFICTSETYTQGVIEQRVVDCLAVLAYDKEGWRPRGLGDGVNVTNLSRHKLGDIEFTNVDERCAIALEAHGGHLSATYVADHRRSLGRIIEQRLAESWANLDDPEKWSINVMFVAHSRDIGGLPTEDILHGVQVDYTYFDYNDLLHKALADSTNDDRLASFELHVIDALNQGTVRESAREKFRDIIAA